MSHPLDPIARLAFSIALRDDRCGEILSHLFDGGGLTFDPSGELILVPAEDIQRLAEGTR